MSVFGAIGSGLKSAAGAAVKAGGTVLKVAGPSVGGTILSGTPLGGGVGLVAQLAAAYVKRKGQASESLVQGPVHYAAAPAAAVATATLLGWLLVALHVPGAEHLAQIACGSPEAGAAIIGLLTTYSHQQGHGMEKAGTPR